MLSVTWSNHMLTAQPEEILCNAMQVWKKAAWKLEANPKGTFVQLDTAQSRKVWYLPEGAMKDGRVQANVLSEDFALIERLLR